MKLPTIPAHREEGGTVYQIDFAPAKATPGHGKAIVSGGHFITDDDNGDTFVVTLPLRLERGC
jgi:hypothetical protein